jgi:SOS-response transcriptional repressor LexA
MNENQTPKPIRPTRKQKILLDYVSTFIAENGYSPSYREIQEGMGYNSIATVSIHVNNLIKRGQLVKRGKVARSLEVVDNLDPIKITSNQVAPSEEKWLVEKIEHAFSEAERNVNNLAQNNVDNLYVLIGALKVLGMEGAAQSFMPRLNTLKQMLAADKV